MSNVHLLKSCVRLLVYAPTAFLFVCSQWDTVLRSTVLSDHGAMSVSCLVPSVIFLRILAAEGQTFWQERDSMHLLRGQWHRGMEGLVFCPFAPLGTS